MLDLTTNPNLVLRVFITLFNLQGARRLASLLMISHRFPFVKNFFQVFSNFLKLFHSPGPLCFTTEASLRAAAALVSDLISLPRASGFVKNFFQIFQSFLFPQRAMTHGARKKTAKAVFFVLALPIFPARLQASIVGRNELNFRVRNGNGWTLILINTNCFNHRSD